jgi:hypothetical protein
MTCRSQRWKRLGCNPAGARMGHTARAQPALNASLAPNQTKIKSLQKAGTDTPKQGARAERVSTGWDDV